MGATEILTAARDYGIPFIASVVVLYLFVRSETQEIPILRELVHEIRELRNDIDQFLKETRHIRW